MSYQSCFGQRWEIPQFQWLIENCSTAMRPDETLFLGDDGGSVGVGMLFEPTWSGGNNFVIDVTMRFRDIPVNYDIKIDFYVVCGGFHHDINSKLIYDPNASKTSLKRMYQCNKENLCTDPSLTPNDTLTLAVRYSIPPKITRIPIQKITTHLDTNPIIDLERLLDDDKFADFVFSVRGVEFKVHKAIMAIRSTVFEAMMQHDMKEKSENRAEIIDVDPAVFKEMLRYIYTGKVGNLGQVVDGLIKVADKYNLAGLKEICEDHLSETLCPENAIELLKQADLLNCERLKAQTIQYIIQNLALVVDTDAWKNLGSYLPAKLISEICYSMSKEKLTLRVSSQSS